ncbi:MAG: hypothetical protein P8X74_16095 [Reinekea sp.]
MLPQNWGEPMGVPAIFEKQIEIKLLPLHPLWSHRFRIFTASFLFPSVFL